MKAEGLEISQPALDSSSLDIHHALTRRVASARAHKNILRNRGSTICTTESNGPPCTRFVEVMAPVFSKAAWRCVWYMIQNDLVHGWGIDFKIVYCSQGIRSEKVGIIDAEYLIHKGIPSLGGPGRNKVSSSKIKIHRSRI
nr:uncharacterized protein LOC112275277 [Physcomitrium patens]|eukprot:XP_024361278.1 uncharacterized protein LOC112275277 [Physcomitrella patens]